MHCKKIEYNLFIQYWNLCVKYYTGGIVTETCTEVLVPTHRELTILEKHQTPNNSMC